MDLHLLYIHVSSYKKEAHICWTYKFPKKKQLFGSLSN